jgi:hypothetical protein
MQHLLRVEKHMLSVNTYWKAMVFRVFSTGANPRDLPLHPVRLQSKLGNRSLLGSNYMNRNCNVRAISAGKYIGAVNYTHSINSYGAAGGVEMLVLDRTASSANPV